MTAEEFAQLTTDYVAATKARLKLISPDLPRGGGDLPRVRRRGMGTRQGVGRRDPSRQAKLSAPADPSEIGSPQSLAPNKRRS